MISPWCQRAHLSSVSAPAITRRLRWHEYRMWGESRNCHTDTCPVMALCKMWLKKQNGDLEILFHLYSTEQRCLTFKLMNLTVFLGGKRTHILTPVGVSVYPIHKYVCSPINGNSLAPPPLRQPLCSYRETREGNRHFNTPDCNGKRLMNRIHTTAFSSSLTRAVTPDLWRRTTHKPDVTM